MMLINTGTFLKRSVPFLFVIYAACASQKENTTATRHHALSKTTSMETIHLKVGDSTLLHFKSLATSGYLWQFDQDKEGIVSIAGENAVKPAKSMQHGQNVEEVFKITALAPGTVHISFRQQRSWQKDKPAAVKAYTVVVA